MSPHEDQEIQGKLFDRALAGRLLEYARPFRLALLISILLLFLMSVIVNALPFIMKLAIDRFLSPEAADLPAPERITGMWEISLVFIGLAVLGFFIRYGQGHLMAWIGQNIVYTMRRDIFAKVMRLPMSFFDRNKVGRLMTRVTSDVDAMQRMVSDGLVGLVSDVFTLGGILVYMVILSPRLSLVLLSILPVLFFTIAYINRGIRVAHRDVRRCQSAINAYIQEMLSGMTTIQLFNQETRVRKRFHELNMDLLDAVFRVVHWFSFFFPAIEVLNALSFGLVLCVGGAAILSGSESIQIGVLVAFLIYIRDFFRPLGDLSDKTNIFQAAMASCERIFALLDTPETITDPEHPAEIDRFRGDVEFKNVHFAYADDNWVLKDISLRIQAGQSAALVGATGAGKTSIISLIARLYDVQEGAVRVDGKEVQAYRQADLRRRIGVVLQDPFIFADTLAANISLNNPDLSRKDIEQAARYVNADSFIRTLPQGYDTEVKERGVSLSTGQKQLIALARALVQNPDILLILDEATANVDTETERLIQDALHKLMEGRTTILIAHRLSTIKDVDRIFVMRNGEIIEDGSHQDLIERNGYYLRLYRLLSHQEH
jgi:ATP-binding cassette subfamily B protein